MRLGLSTPVVIQPPGATPAWEAAADIADVARIATAADKLGFDYLTCSEHIAVPDEDAVRRGSTYWDPLATLSYLAACTTRIRLATSVLVLGYQHPLAIAKRYGTLDRLSGGRVVLGVGVGSAAAEFDVLGASFVDRGARADDAIAALRAAWGTTRPSYDGVFYRFSSLRVEPCGTRRRVPIWVGGRTRRSLRRALELGDGWMPFALSRSEITSMLGGESLPPGFELVLASPRLDPTGDPARCVRKLIALRESGATAVTCSVTATSAAHYCDQLAALRHLADDLGS